jgi:phosphoribosyl-dephospho-CoA transferase
MQNGGDKPALRRQETQFELRYLMGTGPSVGILPPLRARRLDWAALLARVWDVDVLDLDGHLDVGAASRLERGDAS